MKFHNAVYWQKLVVIIGAVLILMVAVTVKQAQGKTVQRPLDDFLSTQGTLCIDDGSGGCLLFVPPDPNFFGWNTDTDKTPVLFAGVDYAGLANAYPGPQPEISGKVTERPLADGRAEVTVELHTKNANAWVIELDLNGDVLDQIANKPTLFGHRPADVMQGAGQALADTVLHIVFINTAPGAPLPDLVAFNTGDLEPGQELKFVAFEANAKGPLTAEFGVPEGTPGKAKISQTGLIIHQGQGKALEDAFPVETIKLQEVGH